MLYQLITADCRRITGQLMAHVATGLYSSEELQQLRKNVLLRMLRFRLNID